MNGIRLWQKAQSENSKVGFICITIIILIVTFLSNFIRLKCNPPSPCVFRVVS